MAQDIRLDDLSFIPQPVLSGLYELEIHTIRQLYERLKTDQSALQDYLRLSAPEFNDIQRKVEKVIKEEFPKDTLSHIYPHVNKHGVAVGRLHDPTRPRYYDKDDK